MVSSGGAHIANNGATRGGTKNYIMKYVKGGISP